MIQVKNSQGQVVREYSEEVHGPAYAELAEQFAASSGLIISKQETTMPEEEKVETPVETTPEETPVETATETPTETAPAEEVTPESTPEEVQA